MGAISSTRPKDLQTMLLRKCIVECVSTGTKKTWLQSPTEWSCPCQTAKTRLNCTTVSFAQTSAKKWTGSPWKTTSEKSFWIFRGMKSPSAIFTINRMNKEKDGAVSNTDRVVTLLFFWKNSTVWKLTVTGSNSSHCFLFLKRKLTRMKLWPKSSSQWTRINASLKLSSIMWKVVHRWKEFHLRLGGDRDRLVRFRSGHLMAGVQNHQQEGLTRGRQSEVQRRLETPGSVSLRPGSRDFQGSHRRGLGLGQGRFRSRRYPNDAKSFKNPPEAPRHPPSNQTHPPEALRSIYA